MGALSLTESHQSSESANFIREIEINGVTCHIMVNNDQNGIKNHKFLNYSTYHLINKDNFRANTMNFFEK
jgi:hypothetical protein